MPTSPTPKVAPIVAASGIDNQELAKALGMSLTTFERRLSGTTNFNGHELIKLANALGRSVSELL